MKKLPLLILTVTFSTIAIGQPTKDYLSSKQIQRLEDSETNSFKFQDYAVLFSKIGNYQASLAAQNLFLLKNKAAMNIPEKPKADSIYFKSFKPQSAVDVIAKAAQSYKVVITNEAHYQPQNRVFTSLLLDTLYKKGFRYLCVEDLSRDDTVYKSKEDNELNSRKYPTTTTGFYMDEPQYGNLVRHALNLGYTLVPYEYYASDVKDMMERIQARENGQAKNIAQIFQNDPNAKILVHCGYGHLNENIIRDSIGQMAAMLKLHYNIDPLTVDPQDMLQENNDPYYRFTNIRKPSVYVSGNHFFKDSTATHKVDMVVFFPKTKYINGRPDWLTYDKSKKYYFVNLKQYKITYPVMISTFHKEEDITIAVPADIIEMNTPDDKVALVLNKGQYILQIKDDAGKVYKQTIQLK
jgi:hypothetical protein